METKKKRASLERWLSTKDGNENEKINAVKSIFESSGAKDYCETKMKSILDESIENLNAIQSDRSKENLMQIARLVIERNK